MFGGDFTLGTEILVQQDKGSCDQTEEQSKSEHNQVSNTLRQRRFTSKEGGIPTVLEEGGEDVVFILDGHGDRFAVKIRFGNETTSMSKLC